MGETSLLTAALAALLAVVTGAAAEAAAPEASPYRLTGEAIPSRYRIALDLDVAGGAFSGRETIELELTSPVRSIRLHAVELEIPSARLRADGRTFDLAPRFDREHETVELAASETLPAGEAALELSFRGPLAAGLSGLYLSRDGERTVVATQMQATYARRAFPCFDEPALKAVFELEVELDAELTVVSNGALLREEPAGAGRKRAVFGPSPRMSTYLVALAASRFDVVEGEADGVPIRVFVAPGKGEQGRWALEVALHSLRFYDRWYGIPYPFGKLDLVAIPSYEWGGMENTAAIYFRESVLLFDPATGSPDQRRRIAGLVAHEVAHQWFGDLVTTAWWDDIWLNEGFASWIQSKPVATLRAEWDRPDDDVAEAQEVMGLDALPTTRSIRGTAASPGEIKELFDGVAYTKGAAVIRMIEAYVGEEAFRRGVNAYLERHAWGNARSEDLWRAIAEVSGREVDRILPTFVERPGVPALAFATAAAPGGTRIEIRQERFFLTGDRGESGDLWRLPVCFRWADAAGVMTERCELLGERAGAWSVPGEVTWLVGNAGGRGYYRVAYTGEQLAALAGAAASLPAAERLALVHDAWAMVEANRVGVDDHLRLVERLDGERNRRVIELVIGTIGEVRRVLAAAADEAAFDIWTRARLAPLAAELGIEPRAGDDDETRSLRATLYGALATAGDAEATAFARRRVEAYLAGPATVDPALAAMAFRVAPKRGDAALFDAIAGALANPVSSDAESQYLTALPRFEDPALVERALRFVDEGRLKLDEYPSYFASLIANPAAQPRAWRYLKEHWSELAPKVVSFGGRGAVPALGAICTAELEAEVREFFAGHAAPGAERALAQALERIRHCLDFRAAQSGRFHAWLGAVSSADRSR